MKKLIFFYVLTFGLFSITHSQQYGWQVINPVSITGAPDFSDVFFTDANTGWITTSTTSNIFKTVDGAASFSTQTTTLGSINAIHMLDASNGYSGGAGGWVYNTYDGGLNWNILASMGNLLDMSFPPGTLPANPVGYACGDNGQVWEITSTLTNLNSGSSTSFSGISAPSVDNVWVCGGNRIYYYNGTNFTSQIAPTGTFNDIHFINNQEGWVVGGAGIIGHTTNGGTSWTEQTNPDTQNRPLYRVFFLDSDNGWAVGNGGIILHTINGGSNWNLEGAGLTSVYLRGVHFTSTAVGYVVGNNKTLLKYTDISGIGDKTMSFEFSLFPNPVSKQFEVRSAEFGVDAGKVELYEMSGKKVMETTIVKGMESIEIDVIKLEAGIYLCKVIIGDRSSTQKIIKE